MGEALPRLQVIFQDVFDREDLVIARASYAASVNGWDSLIQLHLVTTIEREFGVTFDLGELQALRNVGGMLDLLERNGVR